MLVTDFEIGGDGRAGGGRRVGGYEEGRGYARRAGREDWVACDWYAGRLLSNCEPQ